MLPRFCIKHARPTDTLRLVSCWHLLVPSKPMGGPDLRGLRKRNHLQRGIPGLLLVSSRDIRFSWEHRLHAMPVPHVSGRPVQRIDQRLQTLSPWNSPTL